MSYVIGMKNTKGEIIRIDNRVYPELPSERAINNLGFRIARLRNMHVLEKGEEEFARHKHMCEYFVQMNFEGFNGDATLTPHPDDPELIRVTYEHSEDYDFVKMCMPHIDFHIDSDGKLTIAITKAMISFVANGSIIPGWDDTTNTIIGRILVIDETPTKYYTISARSTVEGTVIQSDWVPANQFIYTDPELAKKDMDDLILESLGGECAGVERQLRARNRVNEIVRSVTEPQKSVVDLDFIANWVNNVLHLTLNKNDLVEHAKNVFTAESENTFLIPLDAAQYLLGRPVKEHTTAYIIFSKNFRLNEFELKTK